MFHLSVRKNEDDDTLKPESEVLVKYDCFNRLVSGHLMKQITFTLRNHQLTNINTWTPDSQWLVFDVRPSGTSFTGETIERVNIHTGELEVIYRATQGAHVGVVTVHQSRKNMYSFMGLKILMKHGITTSIIVVG